MPTPEVGPRTGSGSLHRIVFRSKVHREGTEPLRKSLHRKRFHFRDPRAGGPLRAWSLRHPQLREPPTPLRPGQSLRHLPRVRAPTRGRRGRAADLAHRVRRQPVGRAQRDQVREYGPVHVDRVAPVAPWDRRRDTCARPVTVRRPARVHLLERTPSPPTSSPPDPLGGDLGSFTQVEVYQGWTCTIPPPIFSATVGVDTQVEALVGTGMESTSRFGEKCLPH